MAREAARQALALDDSSSAAHEAMGRVRMASDWSWAEAERVSKGGRTGPRRLSIHRGYALHYLAPMGRFEEAIAEAKKAVELDPVNVVSVSTLGNIYYYARRYDLAEAEITKAVELEPNYALGHFFHARIYKQQERHTDAIREAERYVALVGRTGRSLPHACRDLYSRRTRDRRAEAHPGTGCSLASELCLARRSVAGLCGPPGRRQRLYLAREGLRDSRPRARAVEDRSRPWDRSEKTPAIPTSSAASDFHPDYRICATAATTIVRARRTEGGRCCPSGASWSGARSRLVSSRTSSPGAAIESQSADGRLLFFLVLG